MTLIAAFVHEPSGHAYLMGDSIGSNGYSAEVRAQPKVFRKGKLLMGYTSSFRMGQLLEHVLDIPTRAEGQDLMNWLVVDFVEAVRTTLRDGGYSRSKDGEESGGTFLVITEGRIFEIGEDFQVAEMVTEYAAVGAGQDFALGALCAMTGHQRSAAPPLTVLGAAAVAAESHSALVRGPFWVLRDDWQAPRLLHTLSLEDV